MSDQLINPLSKHFRQPVLYLKLPSQGRWYQNGSIELPLNGEIPIYAMTARDEITLKTPDSLLNGTSTVSVIQSCCPNIKDAWKMPSLDLDPVLIAIRLATYGKEMEFTAVCPQCTTKLESALDLSFMLGKIQPNDWSTPIIYENLKIVLKPQSFEDFNKNSTLNFDEKRILQLVSDESILIEEKTKKFDVLFKELVENGILQISKSVESITTPDGITVTDTKFISEYLNNCDRQVWEAIKLKLESIKDADNYSTLSLTCKNAECLKEFTTPFVFEQSSFFA